MIQRIEGEVAADDTPVGLLPRVADIDQEGLELDQKALAGLLSVDHALVEADVESAWEYLGQLGKKMPSQLKAQYDTVKSRLQV